MRIRLLAFVILCGAPFAYSQQLAQTPPMGWNSWNRFHLEISDKLIRETADAMVASGMKDAGYTYINIDDGWEAGRAADGKIIPNDKFPDMKALADYVHSKGLKLGIYSSPNTQTCGKHEGSFGHVEQDAKTYAEWGIDYLKYDWCGATGDMKTEYKRMRDALVSTGRPIVYSLCQYGNERVWSWAPEVGGNLWRTTGDINASWSSIIAITMVQNGLESYAGPGHWNDPDMLEVGNGKLNDEENKAHMALWALLSAPLISGNDLREMTPAVRDVLTHKEVIAIDQDKLGKQARIVRQEGPLVIWVKQLADGSKAVGILNAGNSVNKMTFQLADAGIKNGTGLLRDVWAQKDLGEFKGLYDATVPRHGIVLLRVTQQKDSKKRK